MSKINVIPKGYRVTVVSWENDGDHYNTKIVQVKSKEEVDFIIGYLNIVQKHYANECDYDGQGYENFKELYTQYGKELPEDPDEYWDWFDLAYDLMGGSEHCVVRVPEKVTVEYIPEDIHIEDVSDQFKLNSRY